MLRASIPFVVLSLLVAAAPVGAQVTVPPRDTAPDAAPEADPDAGPEADPNAGPDLPSDMQDGLDLLGEGTRRLLQGLSSELGPALDALRERLDDLDAYYPPEMLPNGDIIIRRRTPLETEIPEGGVDL